MSTVNQNTSTVVELESILDLEAAERLRESMIDAVSRDGDLVFDGTHVKRINTTCIQVIFAAAREMETGGRSVTMRAPSDIVRDAFQTIGLAAEFDRWSEN